MGGASLNRAEWEVDCIITHCCPSSVQDTFSGLRRENVSMEHQVFQACKTRNRLPNYDASIEAATSVRTVATTKTKNSTVYLLDDLFHGLESYKALQDSIARQYPGYNPDGYVFCPENGQPYEPRTYQDLFKRCVRREKGENIFLDKIQKL